MLKKTIWFVALFLLANLFAADYSADLTTKKMAEIKLRNLVEDAGDYKKAVKFSQEAQEKYPNSILIMELRGKALYLTHDLTNAKILFMKILEIDPTNDIATDFINKILSQEEAQKNKDLQEAIDYITDKGLDFLLIFLGFLGADVLAKRFSTCENDSYICAIRKFIYFHKYEDRKTPMGRVLYSIKKYFNNFFTICNLLSIIVILTISAAITIAVSWFELTGYLTFIMSEEQLKIINSAEIWENFLIILFVVFSIIIINRWKNILYESTLDERDIADLLQNLAIRNDFFMLRESIENLNSIISEELQVKILSSCMNKEAKELIERLFNLADSKK
ncbi:hypothetical protein [Sulfurimonas sp.]|uniref:tetratricopeptide repeat protein n=1 Tax=Sulfurimonas sp. TaxID=2022749 RepID=UPI003D0E295A